MKWKFYAAFWTFEKQQCTIGVDYGTFNSKTTGNTVGYIAMKPLPFLSFNMLFLNNEPNTSHHVKNAEANLNSGVAAVVGTRESPTSK